MLNKTKVFNGPFDLVLLAGEVEKYTVSGLKKDSVALSVEPQSEDLEDFSKDVYGYIAKAEVSFSELDTTDMTSIQDPTIDSAEIRFTGKSKKIVVDDPTNIIPSVDSLKTKISIEKFSASSAISDAFAIEAIS
jgi:hypothetical protein